MTAQGAMNGVNKMINKFIDHKNIILEIGRLLGGFDCEDTMKEEYRIVSNTVKDGNDNGSLVSEGISRHPSSNLADNNYFFNVIETINQIKMIHSTLMNLNSYFVILMINIIKTGKWPNNPKKQH